MPRRLTASQKDSLRKKGRKELIAIIDYDAGNLTSVLRAVNYLGARCVVTRDLSAIRRADRVIFPGVGAAGSAMESLRRYGLDAALKDAFAAGKPILGICLGTQVILAHSEENDTPCLGLVPGRVTAFPASMVVNGERLKVPHMGWNSVKVEKPHPVLSGIRDELLFYFVHSYRPCPEDSAHVLAETVYGEPFASVIGFRNLVATQFHPEKSGEPGLSLLRNFMDWRP